jgi:hypothetical protein
MYGLLLVSFFACWAQLFSLVGFCGISDTRGVGAVPLGPGTPGESQLRMDLEGLGLSVASTRTEFQLGEPIELSLCLTNAAKESRGGGSGADLLWFRVRVASEDGTVAQPTAFTGVAWDMAMFRESDHPRLLILRPGEARRTTMELGRFFDFSAAGTYVISVSWPEYPLVPGPDRGKIVSNSLRVVIRPPECGLAGWTIVPQPRTTSPGGVATLGNTNANCSLSLSTEAQRYRAMKPIKLTVMLTNLGSEMLVLPAPTEAAPLRVHVVAPTAAEAALTSWGRLTSTNGRWAPLASARLKPGEVASLVVPLNRVFDMSLAGKYRIAVEVPVAGHSAGGKPRVAKSGELAILVEDQ